MPGPNKITAVEQLVQSESSTVTYAENAEFLPLGVWSQRGRQSVTSEP